MIYRLSERPELAAETASLMTRTWPGHYGAKGAGDAHADVASRIAEDRAAIAVIDGRVLGTVAMATRSFGSKGEGPWLVGLCVAAGAREQGVGTALVTWATGNARRLRHAALYTTTQDAVGLLKRLGWVQVRTISDETGDWSVWKTELRSRPEG